MANQKVVRYKAGDVSGKKGESILTQREAWREESKCGYGIDDCDNSIHLPVNDANGTTTYPAKFEFVNVAGTIKLRVTVDLGAGPVVKEVDLV